RTETSSRMPLRDGKITGYRLVPSIEKKRIEAVRLIGELHVAGMLPGQIRKHLREHGHDHYGKPFQDNAIRTILTNPAYVGMPAWGKYAIGHYRQVFAKMSQKPPRRKRGEPTQYVKDRANFVF